MSTLTVTWTSPFGTYTANPSAAAAIAAERNVISDEIVEWEALYEIGTRSEKAGITRTELTPRRQRLESLSTEGYPSTTLDADEALDRAMKELYGIVDSAKSVFDDHVAKMQAAAENDAWWTMTEDHTMSQREQEIVWQGRFVEAEILRPFANYVSENDYGDAYILWRIAEIGVEQMKKDVLKGYDEPFQSTSLVSNMVSFHKGTAKIKYINNWHIQYLKLFAEFCYNDHFVNGIEQVEFVV